jgi:hypothetical protein
MSRDREGAVLFLPTRDPFFPSRDRQGAVAPLLMNPEGAHP